MKDDLETLKKSVVGKGRVIAITIISIVSVLLLIGTLMWAFKATDHRRELRYALESRDSLRLEQLLKDYPKLVEAELANRGPKDTWNPLHMAACYGDNQAIEILLKHKAKVNAKDANGLTPLHYTVALSRYNSAQLLINKGADMNAKGRDGRSPLELAKNTRDKRMIELFRVRGARE